MQTSVECENLHHADGEFDLTSVISSKEKAMLRSLLSRPLTTKEVADLQNVSEDDALRSIRLCRSYNLVEAERCGRAVLNRLTNEGHVFLQGT